SLQGSLMMRPVFGGACDPFASIPEGGTPGQLSIWPNPASGSFSIALNGPERQVRLIDAMGREIRRWEANADSYPLSDVARGIYLVRTFDAYGKPLAQSRLMVD